MRKSFLFMRLMLGLFVSVFAFTACSSDSDSESESGGGNIEGFRKLSKFTIAWDADDIMSVEALYNSQSLLTGMSMVEIWEDETDRETISAEYGANSIVWKLSADNYTTTYTGTLENNRIVKLEKLSVQQGFEHYASPQYYDFIYEGERLKEIKEDSYTIKVTWNGDNVSKVEEIDNSKQEVIEWAEFTYTNHLAGMLAAVAYFNPFGEFNFFDTVDDAFGFLANKCGTLSKNVPQSVKTWAKNYRKGGENTTNETRVRNYTYTTDAYNYPTKVRIIGDDFLDTGINTQISLTWR